MVLKLDKNESGKFHDITSDKNVENYVMNQMNGLKSKKSNQEVGSAISSVFNNKTSSGSPRLFGTNKNQARADVTIAQDKSVLIQIQKNAGTPSPTYASVTVDPSVKKYLDLNDVPEALNTWENLSEEKINALFKDKNSRDGLIKKMNDLVEIFNENRKNKISGTKKLPKTLTPLKAEYDNSKLAERIATIQRNYNLLRKALIDFRNDERKKRQIEVGKGVVTGLNGSLTSSWTQSPDDKSEMGTKSSFKLTYNK